MRPLIAVQAGMSYTIPTTPTAITRVYHITHCSDSVDGSNKVGVSNGCITSLNGPHWFTGRKDQKQTKKRLERTREE